MNPNFLLELNIDDLNQRYGGSFVLYDGKAEQVDRFIWDNEKYLINFVTDECVEFVPSKLSLIRPEAGWYKVGEIPFYFSLLATRQYARGLNDSNCQVFTLEHHPKLRFSTYVRNALQSSPINTRIEFFSWEHFQKETGNKTVIHRKNFLFTPHSTIWYRFTKIGELDDKAIRLKFPSFATEMKEIFKFPIAITKQPHYKSAF